MALSGYTAVSENCFLVRYAFTETGDVIDRGPFIYPHLVVLVEGSWDAALETPDGETVRYAAPCVYNVPADLFTRNTCVTPGEAYAVFNLENPNMIEELIGLGINLGF